MITVYLAGGMSKEKDWRKEIVKEFIKPSYYYDWYSPTYQEETFKFLNPMEHMLANADAYTSWDLKAIEKCDILLGYMDTDNPSGYGLNLELGYAKALGKIIVLVLKQDLSTDKRNKYFGMARSVADIVFTELYFAVQYLQSFSKL